MHSLSDKHLERIRISNEKTLRVFNSETDRFSNKINRILEHLDKKKKREPYYMELPKIK